MSDYLDQVVTRTLGIEPTIEPRLRGRFEPAPISMQADTEIPESAAELLEFVEEIPSQRVPDVPRIPSRVEDEPPTVEDRHGEQHPPVSEEILPIHKREISPPPTHETQENTGFQVVAEELPPARTEDRFSEPPIRNVNPILQPLKSADESVPPELPRRIEIKVERSAELPINGTDKDKSTPPVSNEPYTRLAQAPRPIVQPTTEETFPETNPHTSDAPRMMSEPLDDAPRQDEIRVQTREQTVPDLASQPPAVIRRMPLSIEQEQKPVRVERPIQRQPETQPPDQTITSPAAIQPASLSIEQEQKPVRVERPIQRQPETQPPDQTITSPAAIQPVYTVKPEQKVDIPSIEPVRRREVTPPSPQLHMPSEEILSSTIAPRLPAERSLNIQQAPTIHVNIGRIEVRTTLIHEEKPPKKRSTAASMGLSEYLRHRDGGSNRE